MILKKISCKPKKIRTHDTVQKNSRTISEPNKKVLHGEKISCIGTSEKKIPCA